MATATKVTLKLSFERSTKNTHIFNGGGAVLYVPKSDMADAPAALTVTLEAA